MKKQFFTITCAWMLCTGNMKAQITYEQAYSNEFGEDFLLRI